ncbi:hypothetical protein CLV47_101456 [Antricoccus suffuscus]|uniref:Nucleotidyltransferase AbiEii toxin of type IV toxin-antitoxin system n=1 Tax=Antricoccus suffuscus TaxID=1629062 RepID=A0A2T1A6W0_9ACTN|nr:hypothetical protein [Antricoccus suffuscus]PRZ44330.1 hypothetical protein CLV47_101456 [Antricoccus suffuscus]
MPDSIHIVSTSNASDLGLIALADLAVAASGTPYRVVGGQMVRLLTHIYPIPGVMERATTDADAGVDELTATGLGLHSALLDQGYTAESGNHYAKELVGQGRLEVDILVPRSVSAKTVRLGGRGFDPIPGLNFALARSPTCVEVNVNLQDGRLLRFVVPIPDVEAALVLKLLAWQKRLAEKDLRDVAALLEIAHAHRESFSQPWYLDDVARAARGERRDAALAAYQTADYLDRGGPKDVHIQPARLRALIERHIRNPK